MRLYKQESSYPKVNAQQNLCGRTHYVDDDTLRFHRSRVLSARHTDEGLLFAITTSDSLDYNHTKRGFRYVIFDVFGNVVERVKIEDAFKRHESCIKAMWKAVNALDAKAITYKAISNAERQYVREIEELRTAVAMINTAKVA